MEQNQKFESLFNGKLKGTGYLVTKVEMNARTGDWKVEANHTSLPSRLDFTVFRELFERSVKSGRLHGAVICEIDDVIEDRCFQAGKNTRKLH